MYDLKLVRLSFTAEFIFIGSENFLFKEINNKHIYNLIERIQFNKR